MDDFLRPEEIIEYPDFQSGCNKILEIVRRDCQHLTPLCDSHRNLMYAISHGDSSNVEPVLILEKEGQFPNLYARIYGTIHREVGIVRKILEFVIGINTQNEVLIGEHQELFNIRLIPPRELLALFQYAFSVELFDAIELEERNLIKTQEVQILIERLKREYYKLRDYLESIAQEYEEYEQELMRA